MIPHLRAATEADRDFLMEVYASTREAELAMVPWDAAAKRLFVEHQFTAQDRHYKQHYHDTSYDVIVADGEPAGRLYVARWQREIRIVDITLLPAFRGRGLGTWLLRELMAEADTTGRKLSIHVERENPARRLYARLGFSDAGEHGVYLLMERPPASGALVDRPLSRRRLVQASGALGAALYLGIEPLSAHARAGTATRSSNGTPFLRRSSYAALTTRDFAAIGLVDGGALRLTLDAVSDVPAAEAVEALAGHEDAFVLTFRGPSALGSGIHALRHPDLGEFELFLSPLGRAQERLVTYQAVIDRTVRLAPEDFAAAPAEPAPAAAAAAAPPAAPTPAPPARRPRTVASWLVAASARRRQDQLFAYVELGRTGDRITASLKRGDVVYARGRRATHAASARIALRPFRRVPAGRYDLVVTLARGRTKVTTKRRITLR